MDIAVAGISAHPLIRRLRNVSPLGPEDEAHLVRITRDVAEFPADRDIKIQGERPDTVHVVVDGLACRYKILPDGRRQIMAFLVPGDPSDLHGFVLGTMDHGLCTLVASRIATIPSDEIMRATAERPLLMRAFCASTLVDQAVLREWVVNIGRRDAHERVAHLLWELYLRHKTVGRARGGTFDLPLTQQELADALGLSAVHVNRTVQRLRAEGVIAMAGRTLTILCPDELQRISGFEADYLHLGTQDDGDDADDEVGKRRLAG